MARKKKISELNESEIIALAKKKSKYFGVLYDRYFDQIFRFVFKRLGGNEDVAGDLTQQTFIKAMANLEKYEDRGFPFSSWLYRIAQNEVSMFFRQEKKNISVSIDENRLQDMAGEANLSSHMSVEQQEMLVECVNGLKPEQQDLIELRFFQAMSFKEIAEIYDITEANAKMRTYRILEKLGKMWKENK
ncbi:MAG: RNA polymerase sigma-70 factor (ECF subfamily) [Crocinitomicaceae bacterium]